MNNLPEAIIRYLNKYGLTGWEIETTQKKKYNNIIVIPAICEYDNIVILLNSLLKLDSKYFLSTLFLFVINNTQNDQEQIVNNNKRTINLFDSFLKNNSKNEKDDLISKLKSTMINLTYIDATSNKKALPKKIGGVGLARKIGMDISLKLFNYKNKNKKIIICLDADCIVEQNYLTEIIEKFNRYNYNVAVINYEHNIDSKDENCKAILCYEIFIRYYHLGLLYAESPYAYQSIGSAMVCDVEAYIKVEGMNTLKAAEDFYFLEKLSKNYKINEINSTSVYPSDRKSWRVPFGTGQRVGRFLEEQRDEYILFNPKSFCILKKWLSVFMNSDYSPREILLKAKTINIELYNFLLTQKFIKKVESIYKNSKNKHQLINQKKIWFGGFKTLKLIHHLRDTTLPEIYMFDALDELFNLLNVKDNIERNIDNNTAIETQKKYLLIMRNYLMNKSNDN